MGQPGGSGNADTEQIYGADVEAMVQEEDAQPLSEPIIGITKKRALRFQHYR